MGWEDGPERPEMRTPPEATPGRRRGLFGNPGFLIAFIAVDVIILGAVLMFVMAR